MSLHLHRNLIRPAPDDQASSNGAKALAETQWMPPAPNELQVQPIRIRSFPGIAVKSYKGDIQKT